MYYDYVGTARKTFLFETPDDDVETEPLDDEEEFGQKKMERLDILNKFFSTLKKLDKE